MRWLLASLIVFGLLIAGCGDNRATEPAEPDATDSELLERVSAAQVFLVPGRPIAYADLVTAREQLGLPSDAGFRGSPEGRELFAAAARPLFAFTRALADAPGLGPLSEVLDAGEIEAAASNNFSITFPPADILYRDNVVVIRTSQSFADIAARLREDGYRERGGLLVNSDRRLRIEDCCPHAQRLDRFPFPVVADAGDGVVVIGGSARVARAALEGVGANLTPAAELVASLPGVVRVATGFAEGGCKVAFGFGEDARPREGEARMVVDGEAEVERAWFLVNMGILGVDDAIRFGQPDVDRESLVIGYTVPSNLEWRNVTWVSIETAERPYRCKAADPVRRVEGGRYELVPRGGKRR